MPELTVVAAVIRDGDGRVLVSRRAGHKHQGGRWEFPGGKLEAGEAEPDGLRRELVEELDLSPLQARPLIALRHDYGDRIIHLRVWQVDAFAGGPAGAIGCEGQEVAWVPLSELAALTFPDANRPIVTAACWPAVWHLPPMLPDMAAWQSWLQQRLSLPARASAAIRHGVIWRQPALSSDEYQAAAEWAVTACHSRGMMLFLHGDPACLQQVPAADGLHLPAELARRYRQRPVDAAHGLLVACHDPDELAHAQLLGADAALLSPVLPTRSHPGAPGLGWTTWSAWVAEVTLPVYALGGLSPDQLPQVWAAGGQGVAGISRF